MAPTATLWSLRTSAGVCGPLRLAYVPPARARSGLLTQAYRVGASRQRWVPLASLTSCGSLVCLRRHPCLAVCGPADGRPSMSVSRWRWLGCILGRMVTRLARGTVADVKEGMVVVANTNYRRMISSVEIRSGRRSTPPAARPVCGRDAAGCCPSGVPRRLGSRMTSCYTHSRLASGYFRSSAYGKYTCPAPACRACTWSVWTS